MKPKYTQYLVTNKYISLPSENQKSSQLSSSTKVFGKKTLIHNHSRLQIISNAQEFNQESKPLAPNSPTPHTSHYISNKLN